MKVRAAMLRGGKAIVARFPMTSSSRLRLALVLCISAASVGVPLYALNKGNAGPEKVEIRFALPPPAPLTPEEALTAFTIESGYRIELVASEPLVEAPVAMNWDDQGRLYVVEMRGYMHDTSGSTEMPE